MTQTSAAPWTRFTRALIIAVVSVWAAACYSHAADDAPFVAPEKPASQQSMTITIPPFAVPDNSEAQRCYYMKAPTDVDLDIGNVLIDFSKGTHHMHVYWGTEDHVDGIEDCFQAVDFDKWHLLVGAQKEHLNWALPDHVSFKVKAKQQLVIQVHFVNAGLLKTDGEDAHGIIRFDPRPPGETHMYMGSIFGQQRTISLPPKSSEVVDGVCRIPHDVHMGALAGHYHFRGHDFTGFRMAADGSDGTQFYKSLSFGEPKFSIFGVDPDAPPLSFSKGEKILWRCNYTNDLEQTVTFGPREIDQEHCNMFAFFYPAAPDNPQEFLPCVSYGRCLKACASNETCSATGDCVPATSCAPKCDGKSCGDDGCGGSCGSCATSDGCTNGSCVTQTCTPSCTGKTCGDDGCGGTCGTCKLGTACSAGSCLGTTCDLNGGSESEPNDYNTAPNMVCADGGIHGAISSATDVDWITFQVPPGGTYSVKLDGMSADLTFSVYRLSSTGSGNINKVNDAVDPGGVGPRSYSATTPIGGTFYAKVYSAYGATSAYTLHTSSQ